MAIGHGVSPSALAHSADEQLSQPGANFTTLRNTILTKQLNESNGQPINGIVATVTDTTSAAALTLTPMELQNAAASS